MISKGSECEESAAELSEGDDLGIDGNEGGGWWPSQDSRFMARKVRFLYLLSTYFSWLNQIDN